eukprot:363169-Chlamydomonas_euryale.AAC.5
MTALRLGKRKADSAPEVIVIADSSSSSDDDTIAARASALVRHGTQGASMDRPEHGKGPKPQRAVAGRDVNPSAKVRRGACMHACMHACLWAWPADSNSQPPRLHSSTHAYRQSPDSRSC